MSLDCTIVFQKNWEAIHAKNEDGSNRYRYIINRGSSRSSKTYSLIDCFDLYARQYDTKRLTVWRDTRTDCRKTVLVDMLKHLKRTGRYQIGNKFNKTESIFTYHQTDSTVEIHGTDDEETVHGLTQDAAWFNEPYKIGKDTFDQIDQRTSDFIFIDYNPKKGHWVEDLMKDPRAIVIDSTFKDNPFCPPEQRKKILSYQPVAACAIVTEGHLPTSDAQVYDVEKNEDGFTDKAIAELVRCRENEYKNSANLFKWQVYGLGTKGERPNRIFHWTEIPEADYHALDAETIICCDWGKVDPWAILEMKYYDGGVYLHELNYSSENEIRSRLTTTEQAQIAGDEEGIVTWMFNKLGIDKNKEVICDTNRPLKIAILRRGGWNAIPAVKAKNSILDGIDLLDNLEVYYTKSSVNIAYEQENYSRKEDNKGVVLEEPEDMDNHHMDCARYGTLYFLGRGKIRKM
jgi:phage terminase large subunit